MCESLADEPGVVMERKSRLNKSRDGWVIVEYRCPKCRWQPQAITACLDEVSPRAKQSLVIATEQEVEEYTRPQQPLRGKLIALPEPKPVELEELYHYVVEKFPLSLPLGDKTLTRKVTKKLERDAQGNSTVGVVQLIYSEGKGVASQFSLVRPELALFCTGGLPDVEKSLDQMREKLASNLKLLNQEPEKAPERVVFNRQGSLMKMACGYDIGNGVACGDRTGSCGHPGVLANVRSPGMMQAPATLLQAPDGTPIPTLQAKMEQEAGVY
jgi:hypothetical protein